MIAHRTKPWLFKRQRVLPGDGQARAPWGVSGSWWWRIVVIGFVVGWGSQAEEVQAQTPPVSLRLDVLNESQPSWTYWMTQVSTAQWGTIPVGRSISQRLRIWNTGTTAANLAGLEITGSSAAQFQTGGVNAVTLLPQQAVEFSVVFTPAEVGAVSATLRVVGQHEGETLLSRSLTGTGKVARVFQLEKPDGSVWQNQDVLALSDVTLQTYAGAVLGKFKERWVPGVQGLGGGTVFRARLEGPSAEEFSAVFYEDGYWAPDAEVVRFDYFGNEFNLNVGFAPISAGSKEAWLVIEELPQSGQFTSNSSLRLRLVAKGLKPGKPKFVKQPKSAFNVLHAIGDYQAVGGETFRATVWRQSKVLGRINLEHPFFHQVWDLDGWDRHSWGSYRIELANRYGSTLSREFWIGQISDPEEMEPVRLPAGRTGKVVSKARAPALRFQWMRNGVPLVEGEKYAGVNKRELAVKNVTAEDAGPYQCRLTMPAPDGPVSTDEPVVLATVYQRPEVKPFSLRPTQVFEAHSFDIELKADNDWEHTFRIEGLPPGLRQTSRWGEVGGRIAPTAAAQRARDYVIRVWATNGAGTSEPFVTTWRVEPYSFSEFKGSYEGLFAMTDWFAGGRLRLLLDGKGGFSGTVRRPWKGGVKAVRGLLFAPGVAGYDGPAEGEAAWPLGMIAAGASPFGVAFYNYDRDAERLEWLIFAIDGNRVIGEIDRGQTTDPAFLALRSAAPPGAAEGLHHLQIGGADWTPSGQRLTVPGGSGFARVWLGANGVARWVSRLGDSTSASGSAGGGWLLEANQWVLPMRHEHKPTWSEAHGWVAWLDGESVSLAGEWQWKKRRAFSSSPTAWQRYYGNGFWLPQVMVEGSRFTVPQPGELAEGWSTQSPSAVAELAGDSAGWTAAVPEKRSVLVRPSGQVLAGDQTAGGADWQRMVVRFVPKTGLVSGRFVRPTGNEPVTLSRVQFEGLWIPHLGRAVGVNWMTLPPSLVPSGSKIVPTVAGPLDFGPALENSSAAAAEP